MLVSLKTVFNQVHYKKTANIAGTSATSRLVTFSRLVVRCTMCVDSREVTVIKNIKHDI